LKMPLTILLDHDLEGRVVFLEAGLKETGWNQDLNIEFKRLRDLNLAEDSTDQEIWGYVQRERLLFITSNRSRDDENFTGSRHRKGEQVGLAASANDLRPGQADSGGIPPESRRQTHAANHRHRRLPRHGPNLPSIVVFKAGGSRIPK